MSVKIDDFTYYVESYKELEDVVDNDYWLNFGMSDRGSCIECYKNSFTYPCFVMLSNYYAPCGELYSVEVRNFSERLIEVLHQQLKKIKGDLK